MFEIDQEKVKSWVQLEKNQNTFGPKNLDIACPNPSCQRSLVNLNLSWEVGGNFIWTRINCQGCHKQSHFFIIPTPRAEKHEKLKEAYIFMYPAPPIHPELEPGVSEVSENFVNIYSQAVKAEALGLTALNGIGYRKALEFLIKDYLCKKFPDRSEEIKKKFLGNCIQEDVSDPNIKEVARRAVWLGNDETHYIRIWEDKDIEDLKILLKLTQYWISIEYLTQKYTSGMKKGT